MTGFDTIPTPPPRRAKSFRKFGRWFMLAAILVAPFSVHQFFILAFLSLGAGICFLGIVLEERRISHPPLAIIVAWFFLLVICVLSTWFSLAPHESLFGGLSAPDSLAGYIVLGMLGFFAFLFFTAEDLPWIAGIGIVSLLGAILWSGSYSWSVLVAALFAGGAVVRPGELRGWMRFVFWGGMMVAAGLLVFLNNQSLWLCVAIFVVVLVLLRFGPREQFQYAFAMVTLALFFALVSSRLPILQKPVASNQMTMAVTANVLTGVLHGRTIMLGTGPSTFNLDFMAYRPAAFNMTNAWMASYREGHDFAITLLAVGGLLGFVGFLAIAFFLFQPFLQIAHREVRHSFVISTGTFLLVSLFLYPASYATLAVLALLTGFANVFSEKKSFAFSHISPGKSFAVSAGIMVCAAFMLAGGFIIGEQCVARAFLQQSNALLAAGKVKDAFDAINNAIRLDPEDEYYRAASNILIAEARVLAASNDPLASPNFARAIAGAVEAAENAVHQNPRDTINWENLGSVYEVIMPVVSGGAQSARNAYDQAGTLDPNNPRWPFMSGRVLMEAAETLPSETSNPSAQQADRLAIETYLNKAIALKGDYADARVLLVNLYVEEGNFQQAIQRVQELKIQHPLDVGVAFELGYLYYQSGSFNQAAEELQVATILDPTYANAWYFLGLLYERQGMLAQATGAFQKVIALNPDNTQAAEILANLKSGKILSPNATSSPGSSLLNGIPATPQPAAALRTSVIK